MSKITAPFYGNTVPVKLGRGRHADINSDGNVQVTGNFHTFYIAARDIERLFQMVREHRKKPIKGYRFSVEVR